MKKVYPLRPHYWITIPVLSVLGICSWMYVSYPKGPLVKLPVYRSGMHSSVDRSPTSDVYMDQNGHFWYDGNRVDESEIFRRLDSLKRDDWRDISIDIHADERLDFHRVWALIEALNRNGLWVSRN